MNPHDLEQCAHRFTLASPLNHAKPEKSRQEIRLFDEPLFGYACADDALFDAFLEPSVIGAHFRRPAEWLSAARTVVSFFLPFSEEVRISNRTQKDVPSENWLYGRIEGQQFVFALCGALAQQLRDEGYQVIIPSASEEFWTVSPADESGLSFTSNWSERHAAFACGLGTFGLSKGLITEKGMAGRFGSLITDWEAPPTPRPYTQVYEYCTRCGKCASRCPGHAISLEDGKSHPLCYEYQMGVLPGLLPRFGCGLCQTDVPCECARPRRA